MSIPFKTWLASAGVVAIALTGCQTDTDSQPNTTLLPLPTASATPDPQPSSSTPRQTPTPTPVDSDPQTVAVAAVEATRSLLNSIWGLPVDTTVAPDDVTTSIDTMTAAESSARAFAQGQLSLALDPELALRGDVMGQPMGPAELGEDGTFTVEACLSVLTENALDNPPPDGIGTSQGRYLTTSISGQIVDNQIVLTNTIDPTNPDPANCIPETIATDVTAAWQQFIDATVTYRRDTTDDQARRELQALVVGDSFVLDEFDYSVILDDILVEPGVYEAERRVAAVTWCQRPSENDNAKRINPDGTEEQLNNLVFNSVWELADSDEWQLNRMSSYTSKRQQDVQELWDRCHGN